jgi:hypothetical protein
MSVLPSPRGLDHIVHAVRDLDAAGETYGRLGFRVGARNSHPWGTDNRIVQFADCFMELLTVAQPDKITPFASRKYSFGAFNRDFLESREGLSMLVLESHRDGGDAEEFAASGIGDFEVFPFAREGRNPKGEPVQVAFTLSFASDPLAPNAGFFTCRQHHPENFWNPAFQKHANTTQGVAGVVLVAENPTDHHIFLSAFVGERELQSTSSGITVNTPHGEIQVMDPAAFRAHFGTEPPAVDNGARLAAVRFAVRDPGAAERAVQASGIVAAPHMGRLVIGPHVAMGATLVFEASR